MVAIWAIQSTPYHYTCRLQTLGYLDHMCSGLKKKTQTCNFIAYARSFMFVPDLHEFENSMY
jgi:hypothetical protein